MERFLLRSGVLCYVFKNILIYKNVLVAGTLEITSLLFAVNYATELTGRSICVLYF
jgi:hypothetical protein